MKLFKIGRDEPLNKRITRRGRVEQSLFIERKKAKTKRTTGHEKQLTRNFLKVRKIRSRGMDKSFWQDINKILK